MSAIGPSTNATCLSGFSWANDAAGNSPCFVAAAVVGACLNADYNVPPLIPGNHYANAQPVNGCSCSWAAYNLLSACTACQGFNESILTWAGYNTNCTGSLISNTTYYPSDVVTLDNTSIPFYATTNPFAWQDAIFNIDQAQNISKQDHPDVYGAPITSSTPSKHKSNAGAIGGGVAGGVVALLIGSIIVWWILRKRGYTRRRRNGKPQEIEIFDNQSHTRSLSDLTPSNIGDQGFGNSGYTNTVSMQQPQMHGFVPDPFASASNMASVSSIGAFYTPPSQTRLASSPSMYSGDANDIISRYSSPSPSMQYMNRGQSPDSNHMTINTTFGNDVSIQPFILPPASTSPPPLPATMTKAQAEVHHSPTRGSQDSPKSIDQPSSAPRRVNPPAYDDVALSDSRDVAAQRRESHGTGHVSRPPLGEKQLSQVSQTTQGSQDSSIWTTPASNTHGGPDFAAIDSYVGQMASSNARPGGAGGAGTVPVLHTTALAPGTAVAGPSFSKRFTVNTTVDDGDTSVLNGGEDDQENLAIA